ncbi:MAG: ankyrin repeat domain-containing protein [Candidatus Amoebophilus sp.]
MISFKYIRLLIVVVLLATISAKCSSCQNNKLGELTDIHLSITLSKDIFYIEDGKTPITLTIKSEEQIASSLNYKCVAWSVKSGLGKLVNESGDPIELGYALKYGDNELYYEPTSGSEGKHVLEVTVSDEDGRVEKKRQIEILVKDHRPVDFQVKIQSDKPTLFAHQQAKLVINISSDEKEASALSYQIQSITSSKEGATFTTPESNSIGAGHALKYGTSSLCYDPNKQLGEHTIKLVAANAKGDIRVATATLTVSELPFQVQLKLEEANVFTNQPAKLIVDITSPHEDEASELTYEVKSMSSSKEGISFSTPETSSIAAGHNLKYGTSILLYNPSSQLGKHTIKLAIKNSNGTSKAVTASFDVMSMDYKVALKAEKPTVFVHHPTKLIVDVTSTQQEARKLSYTIKEINANKENVSFTSLEGENVGAGYTLEYGRNVLYYNPSNKLGVHDIKLVIISSRGDIKQITTSVSIMDADFELQLKPEKPVVFSHQLAKVSVNIHAPQKEAKELSYRVKEISSDKGGLFFTTTEQNEAVVPSYELKYGINTLYYNTARQTGVHTIKLVVENSNGSVQTVTAPVHIMDADFQVQLQPEKAKVFIHQKVLLAVNITSPQEAGSELTYQVKEISTSQEGVSFTTLEGDDIVAGHTLKYGKNTWHYNTANKMGMHDIKLVVENSNGTTRTVTASVEVVDVDYKVELKPEKSSIFSHHPGKLILDIYSNQKEAKELTYKVKKIRATNRENISFTTIEGKELTAGHLLKYGKNELYYNANRQIGVHDLKLTVINSNDSSKTAIASMNIVDADFFTQVKINEVTRNSEKALELSIHVGSSIGSKEDKWQLTSWEIEGGKVGKLQDAASEELKASQVAIRSAENRFGLMLFKQAELSSLPQLKLVIKQPDGIEKPFVLDLSNYIFPSLRDSIKTLEESIKTASKSFITGERFAVEKFNRAISQLKTIKNNLNILGNSASIDKGQLEDTIVKVDDLFNYSRTVEMDKAIYDKFGRGINEKDSYGRTPLIEAIDKADTTLFDLVLRHPRVDLKASHTIASKNNQVAYPALHYTIIKHASNTTFLSKLLERGAKVTDRVFLSKEALNIPLEGEEIEFIKMPSATQTRHIIPSGEVILNMDNSVLEEEATNLNRQIAAYNEKLVQNAIVQTEWSAHHMLANQDDKGDTALHIAAIEKLVEPIKMLLSKKINVNTKNGYWQTPLHVAISSGTPVSDTKLIEVVKYLISRGADVNATDLNDNTPLHYAVYTGNLELIQLLLDSGAIYNLKNRLQGKNRFGSTISKEGWNFYQLAKKLNFYGDKKFIDIEKIKHVFHAKKQQDPRGRERPAITEKEGIRRAQLQKELKKLEEAKSKYQAEERARIEEDNNTIRELLQATLEVNQILDKYLNENFKNKQYNNLKHLRNAIPRKLEIFEDTLRKLGNLKILARRLTSENTISLQKITDIQIPEIKRKKRLLDAEYESWHKVIRSVCDTETETEVEKYIQYIYNSNARGNFFVHMWATRGIQDEEGSKFILGKTLDVNTKNNKGFTPLQLAIKMLIDEKKDFYKITELLSHGADPNIKYPNGEACIFQALRWANQSHVPQESKRLAYELLITLLDHGASPSIDDSADFMGWTPLMFVIRNDTTEHRESKVRKLLESGAKVFTPRHTGGFSQYYEDRKDWTPYHAAAELGDVNILKLLYDYDKDNKWDYPANIYMSGRIVRCTPTDVTSHLTSDEEQAIKRLLNVG